MDLLDVKIQVGLGREVSLANVADVRTVVFVNTINVALEGVLRSKSSLTHWTLERLQLEVSRLDVLRQDVLQLEFLLARVALERTLGRNGFVAVNFPQMLLENDVALEFFVATLAGEVPGLKVDHVDVTLQLGALVK